MGIGLQKNKILEQILDEVDKHPEIMSRRDAFKYLTLSPLAASLIAGTTISSSALHASNAREKIIIVGGGPAGISTAARLNNTLNNADITIIEKDPLSASYRAGLTLVASGIWTIDEIKYKTDDKIPEGVTLIKGDVTSYDPKNNTLTINQKEEIKYDHLIIATEDVLDYSSIKGLDAKITSSSEDLNALKKSGLTKNGLHSLFFQDGAVATWGGVKELIEKAKIHTGSTKLKAIFTHPNIPIQYACQAKEIMYLVHSRLLEAKVRDKVEMIFSTSSTSMFGINEFDKAIEKQFKKRDFQFNYNHNLIELDAPNKVAIFNKNDGKLEKIELRYDFLHVTPRFKSPHTITSSPLATSNGLVSINKETLQHLQFKNVWSLDAINGSIAKQHLVLCDNIVIYMQNKAAQLTKYNGYHAYPLVTNIGSVMYAEYNLNMELSPTLPLNATQERWIWWLMKIYILKPLTMLKMMKGYA